MEKLITFPYQILAIIGILPGALIAFSGVAFPILSLFGPKRGGGDVQVSSAGEELARVWPPSLLSSAIYLLGAFCIVTGAVMMNISMRR